MITPRSNFPDNFPRTTVISKPQPATPIPLHFSQTPLINHESLKVLDIGSIEFWMRPVANSTVSEMCLFSINQNDLAFYVSNDLKKAIVYLAKVRFEFKFDFTLQDFNHICILAKSGTLTINNGASDFHFSLTDPSAKLLIVKTALYKFDIGHNGGNQLFSGRIERLKLWNAALDNAEINASAEAASLGILPIPIYSESTRHNMGPGIAPSSLLGYLWEDTQGGLDFHYHYEATGSYILETKSQIDTLAIENQELEYVSFIGLSRDPNDAELILVTDAEMYSYSFSPIGPNLYQDNRHHHFQLQILAGSDAINGEYSIKLMGTLPGHGYMQLGEYVLSRRDESDVGNAQTWGSVFPHRALGSLEFLLGWTPFDKNFDFLHPAEGTSDNKVFSEPNGNSKDFKKAIDPSGNVIAIQYGIIRITESFSTGTFSSSFVSSVKDYQKKVVDGQDFTIGSSAGFMGLKAGPTFNISHSTEKLSQEISSQEKTLAIRQYVNLSYTLALEKRNMLLHPNFVSHVYNLLDHPSKSNFKSFLDTFGTHYANAAAVGGRSFSKSTMEKKAVTKLAQEGTNIKLGFNYKAEVDIKGVEFGDNIGGSVQKGQTEATKLENTDGVQVETFETWGVTSAFGNIPASPSGNSAAIIMIDLKPLSNLLAPPYFDEYEIVIDLRNKLHQEILKRAGSSQLHVGTRYITIEFGNLKTPYGSDTKVHWDILVEFGSTSQKAVSKQSLKKLSHSKVLALIPMTDCKLKIMIASMDKAVATHTVIRKDLMGKALETKDTYDGVEYATGVKVKNDIHLTESSDRFSGQIKQKVKHHTKTVDWKENEIFSPGYTNAREDELEFFIEFDYHIQFIDSNTIFTGIDTSKPLLNEQY